MTLPLNYLRWLINDLIKEGLCNKHSVDISMTKIKFLKMTEIWPYESINQSASQKVNWTREIKKNVPSILDPRVSQVNCEIFSQTLALQGWTIVGHYFAGFWEVTTKNHLYLRLVHVLLSGFYHDFILIKFGQVGF